MSDLLAPQETIRSADQVASSRAGDGFDGQRLTWMQRNCRSLLKSRLQNMSTGQIRFNERNGGFDLGSEGSMRSMIDIADTRFYTHAVMGGGIGAAEAFIRRFWDTDDLVTTMRIFARQSANMQSLDRGVGRVANLLRTPFKWLKQNTLRQSRKNISAHYDLGNDFFALMLDPTMTYSSGIFRSDDSTLEEASSEKYDRICRQLELKPTDHVVEIGCGWGGFAEHAASRYGCKVTATTISNEQHDYAKRRFENAGLSDRITLLKSDYRNLTGQYDKLVSIEMIEAVGEKYLTTFFDKCSSLLKSDGAMMLQAITIPDHRYDNYRKSMDFIQRYIFPGGFLPSFGAIGNAIRTATDFRVVAWDDFGIDYAETLAAWRRRFWKNIETIQRMGYDDRFIRTWHYYLCYCEAGFRERQIGVVQAKFTKPGWQGDKA